MDKTNKQAHWENIYQTKSPEEVSWTQAYPKASMNFIQEIALNKSAAIIDIGGGDSKLVDRLLEQGYLNLSVLDISNKALVRAQERLGTNAEEVNWIESDISDFEPETQYDFWHDRAAFHFLTDVREIEKYVDLVSRSIRPGGYFFIGAFSPNGPEKCSGIKIQQYSEHSMKALFSDNFETIKCFREDHTTPFGTSQNFQFCAFQRKGD